MVTTSQVQLIPTWLQQPNTDLVKCSMGKNRLREIREINKLSREALADLVGTTGTQIYRLENGMRKLTDEWKARLAPALHCSVQDFIEITTTAPIIGYLTYSTIGGEAFAYKDTYPLVLFRDSIAEVSNKKYKTGGSMKEAIDFAVTDIPQDVTGSHIVALEVKNDPTLTPWMDGWKIGYSQVNEANMESLIDSPCMCMITGMPTPLLRVLRKGRQYGKYDLISLGNSKPLEDKEVIWCAKVLFIRPV